MPDCSLIANQILGDTGLLMAFDIDLDCDSDTVARNLQQEVEDCDRGNGVLILCDLKGATPGNIATRAHMKHAESSLVFGVNLPMLLRGINYMHQHHAAVAKAAIAGARNCITMAE
ncbi:MAG: PTS fructose transporter subunit IIA [Gammaproteobacteria bacterium]